MTDTETDTDEIVVTFQDETLLLGGDPAAVESYLARLRATHGTRYASRRNRQRLARERRQQVRRAGSRYWQSSGKYVQLHRDSLERAEGWQS